MITPLDNTIKEIMGLTWPMVFISTLILSSIRLADILKNKKKFILYRELFNLVFIIYVLILFQAVTFEDPTIGFGRANLVPFKEMLRYQVGSRLFFKNVLGNLVMFVPYGVFISTYISLDNKWQALCLIFFASTTVEATQSIIGRVFDVDDIILNVIGGMIGYGIYYLLLKIGHKMPKWIQNTTFLNIMMSLLLIGIVGYIWRIIL